MDVYEGDLVSDLWGRFVFADHRSGQIMFGQMLDDEWVLTRGIMLQGQYVNSVDAEGDFVISTMLGWSCELGVA